MDMKEITLESGAVLKIGKIPFSESEALFEIIMTEFRTTQFSAQTDVAAIIKDVLCFAFSSRSVKVALKKCLQRCLYNNGAGDFKVEDSLFESEETRGDYILVCTEVMEHALRPFTKHLSAVFARLALMMQSIQK